MQSVAIGYARVAINEQDLTAQRQAPAGLGVTPEQNYVDHGVSGTHRARPGLRQALVVCRHGDTPVVTKLDRLARSNKRTGPAPTGTGQDGSSAGAASATQCCENHTTYRCRSHAGVQRHTT